jgi:hypothetical protein
MSNPKYEFERYYAEKDKSRPGTTVWTVMGEDKPGNLQSLGHMLKSEAEAHIAANYYNYTYTTGFDSKTDKFINPEKQERWAFEQDRLSIKKDMEKMDRASTKTTILKARTNEPENEQETTQAIEESYPGWATFGSSSKNENDQTTPKITIDGKDRWTNF